MQRAPDKWDCCFAACTFFSSFQRLGRIPVPSLVHARPPVPRQTTPRHTHSGRKNTLGVLTQTLTVGRQYQSDFYEKGKGRQRHEQASSHRCRRNYLQGEYNPAGEIPLSQQIRDLFGGTRRCLGGQLDCRPSDYSRNKRGDGYHSTAQTGHCH